MRIFVENKILTVNVLGAQHDESIFIENDG